MAENEATQLAKGQTNVPVASTSPGIFQSWRHRQKLGCFLIKLIQKLKCKPLQFSGQAPCLVFLKEA